MSLTIFSSCNHSYEPFAIPYAISALSHNDDAVVEICVENSERTISENRSALAIVDEVFPSRLLIRTGTFSRRIANSVRFLELPLINSTHTYIGDVDILILERNISQHHINHMKDTKLPYSNVIRPGTQRLTGLHFTETSCHYPLNLGDDFDISGNDEHLLYRIIVEKGLPLPDISDDFRPVHGYHLSLNRSPTYSPGRVQWGLSDRYLAAYLELKASDVWRRCLPFFSQPYQSLLLILDSALQATHADLEIFDPGSLKKHFVEMSATRTRVSDDVFEVRRRELIQERKFVEAIELVGVQIRAQPFEAVHFHHMAWLQAATKNVARAVDFEKMACELSPGNSAYRESLEGYIQHLGSCRSRLLRDDDEALTG